MMTPVQIKDRLDQIAAELSVPTTALWFGHDLRREKASLEEQLRGHMRRMVAANGADHD